MNREGATEYEEILGYHLEQAHRYLSELGPLDDRGREIGADASRRLAAAGRRAFARGDVPAAVNLLGRAADLLPREAPERLELIPDYAEALGQVFRFSECEAVLDDAIAVADEIGVPRIRAHAELIRLRVQLRAGQSESWQEEAAVTIAEAMAVLEEAGDDVGLARAWRALNLSHGMALRFGLAAESAEHALEHAGVRAMPGRRSASRPLHTLRRRCSAPRRCPRRSLAARRSSAG